MYHGAFRLVDCAGRGERIRASRLEIALVGHSAGGRVAIDAAARNTDLGHFSVRLGRLNGSQAPYDNPAGADQSLWIGFEDAGGLVIWHQQTGTPRAQIHLSTRRIPVSAMDGIDLADIRGIHLWFAAGTHGTLAVDNLEWDRD